MFVCVHSCTQLFEKREVHLRPQTSEVTAPRHGASDAANQFEGFLRSTTGKPHDSSNRAAFSEHAFKAR